MTTSWRSQMQDVAAEIDGAFGESVTVTPMTRAVNQSATSDRSRAPVTVCAVFSWRSEMAFNDRNSRAVSSGNIDTAPLISTRKPCFSFRFGALPFAIRQADRIKRLSDGRVFEIKEVKSDGVSRVEAEVVQLGQEPPDYVVACTRFRRHQVRCFNGTGGASWNVGSSRGSSSLRLYG